MRILFTLCGRAGSKGIKNKNIREFLGYQLSYYTLAAIALYQERNAEDQFDVVVNTDSEELISITQNNPFVPVSIIRRIEELSGDRVAKTAVINDCLNQMQERTGNRYDMVVDLDLTSPLRKVSDIVHLIEVEKEKRADVTFSVTDARRNPYFNMVIQAEKGVKKVLPSDFVARQQAPAVYDMNASMYAYLPEYLQRTTNVLEGYCEVIVMEDTGILDLDHENDFGLMEVIAKYLYDNNEEFGEVYHYIQAKTG